MSKRQKRKIQESMEDLQHLERHYRDKPQEDRIRMLRFWKEQAQLTQKELVKLLGRSRETIQRDGGVPIEKGAWGLGGSPECQRKGWQKAHKGRTSRLNSFE